MTSGRERKRLAASGASFNVPRYDGQPREAALVWTLSKGWKTARCALWTHPLGAELRVDVNGELVRSEAGRDVLALIELSTAWRTQFQEKGWTA